MKPLEAREKQENLIMIISFTGHNLVQLPFSFVKLCVTAFNAISQSNTEKSQSFTEIKNNQL
jgi:hypothetical protein